MAPGPYLAPPLVFVNKVLLIKTMIMGSGVGTRSRGEGRGRTMEGVRKQVGGKKQ